MKSLKKIMFIGVAFILIAVTSVMITGCNQMRRVSRVDLNAFYSVLGESGFIVAQGDHDTQFWLWAGSRRAREWHFADSECGTIEFDIWRFQSYWDSVPVFDELIRGSGSGSSGSGEIGGGMWGTWEWDRRSHAGIFRVVYRVDNWIVRGRGPTSERGHINYLIRQIAV